MKRPKIDEYNALLIHRAQAARVQKLLKENHANGVELRMSHQGRIDPYAMNVRTDRFEHFGAAFGNEMEQLIKERQHELVAEAMARLDAKIAKAADAAREEALALLVEVEAAAKRTGGAA